MSGQDDTTATESTATEAQAQGQEQGQDVTTEPQATKEETITISQADLDKRIGNAVFKARENIDAEYQAKLEADKAEAEKARLAEQGKHKEHAELVQAELDALKAETERAAFKDASRAALKEAGLSDFDDVLLDTPDTVDGIQTRAAAIKAKIDQAVQVEVAKRLDTGTHITETGTRPTPKDYADMTTEEWAKERMRLNYPDITPPHLRAKTM